MWIVTWHSFEIQAGQSGPTEKTKNRTEIRFFKHKKPDIHKFWENRTNRGSTGKTGRTVCRFNRSFQPYRSLYRISAEILVPNWNRKNSSFRSETIGDLPACCAHVTASIIRTFLPCFPDQMSFLLLFLQPISWICSFTFSSLFVHPVPPYFILFLMFLFQFASSVSFCH